MTYRFSLGTQIAPTQLSAGSVGTSDQSVTRTIAQATARSSKVSLRFTAGLCREQA